MEAGQGQLAAGAGNGEQAARLSWAQRVQVALDAARGLAYLHEEVRPPVTHGDIRSTNVLLFDGFRAKIADNDMFREIEAQLTDPGHAVVQPLRCLAPE